MEMVVAVIRTRIHLLVFLMWMSCLAGCGNVSEHQLRGRAMGTTWSLRYVGEEDVALVGKIGARLEALESIFSTWRKDSVVSRLNRGEEVDLPVEYLEVAALGEAVRLASDGAFDVSIGERVGAIGFGSEFLGKLDFSGIAKGFALDEVGKLLRGEGVDEFLFELGGELLAAGDRDWRVGLESPDPGAVGEVRQVIVLRDQAVATSGSYRLFRGDVNHLIDPRSGESVAHDCVSVSVVAKTCAEADAYATALMVLGLERGRELADRQGLKAYFVRRGHGKPMLDDQ